MRTEPGLGLYLHVPFCAAKCAYCDFFSLPVARLIPAYLEALGREIDLLAHPPEPVTTLYLGGGTPTRLSDEELAGIMARLRAAFVLDPQAEVTLEANPEDVTPARARAWLALGFNRLSLGIQSFDDAELAFLGRRHTAAQAGAAFETLRAAGFTNLGLDLISGLPGQAEPAWLGHLERALALGPEHLSCYGLTLAAGTRLARLAEAGELALPGEEEERQTFLLTSRFLEGRGYEHYEVSNFARPGFRSRHNQKYWTHAPYLGLGPSAHSFKDGRRWWNVRSLRGYAEALAQGRPALGGEERLTPAQIRLEAVYLGCRTKLGVDLAVVLDLPGAREIVDQVVGQGLMEPRAGRLIPTREGLAVAEGLALLLAG